MEKQPALKFLRFEVTKILFDRGDDPKDTGPYTINVNLESQVNDLNQNLIRAIFIIDITDDKQFVTAQVKAMGVFEIVGDVNDALRQNFYNISAPSIVFPYCRAFVSNLFLQSGLNPIIIPPFNFAGQINPSFDAAKTTKLIKRPRKKSRFTPE
jgi:preprotein translocase subunit SecB